MFSIIVQLFFFLGLVIIIFLIARKTPKVIEGLNLNKSETLDDQIENHIGKTFFKIPWDKIDRASEKFLEKMMRRLHIITMKLEIFLQKRLESLKKKDAEKTSFVEQINNQKVEDENKETNNDLDLTKIDLDIDKSLKIDNINSDNENNFQDNNLENLEEEKFLKFKEEIKLENEFFKDSNLAESKNIKVKNNKEKDIIENKAKKNNKNSSSKLSKKNSNKKIN